MHTSQPWTFFVFEETIRVLLLSTLFCWLSLSSSLASAPTGLTPGYLRCEYLVDPLGIDIVQPRLSWVLTSEQRHQRQSAYRILVASSPALLAQDQGDLWDSKRVNTDSTNQIVYQGKPLSSRQLCYWKVKVWNQDELASDWSELAYWSMGLLHYSDWQAEWITLNVGSFSGNQYDSLYLPPARYLRQVFTVNKPIRRAMVYASAAGLYELHLNGQRIGRDFFTPGWSDYDKRIYYNTYEITDYLKEGNNAIGAILADGWYAGYLGYGLLGQKEVVRGFYGKNPLFIGQIEIIYQDGSRQTIGTDGTWKASEGPIREADILMGETYDARQELTGWSEADYNDTAWQKPADATYFITPAGKLQAYPGVTVQYQEYLTPQKTTEPTPGTYVFDLGKNFAGKVRLQVQGPAGTTITLRYAEMLHQDGTLMRENLRDARATDTYILKGQGLEVWEPSFTYHGFQYVSLTGLPTAPTPETITGIVMNSDTPYQSNFSCSNPVSNQLYENILTTQAANFFEVPTDCPQRDERLGWTGDAQIYVRSATYNADVAAFFTKWLIDLDDAQRWYGAYPDFAPFPYSNTHDYAPAWMDAGVIVPYTIYQAYGDTRILERMYPGMQRFMEFQRGESQDYLRPGGGNNYGDWLTLGKRTSDDYVGAAYYGYDARLMAEMAEALGKTADAQHYRQLYDNIRKAFAQRYIQADGTTTEDTQTSYALALYFGLYPDALAQRGADRLAELIQDNGNRFDTGFLGTKHVMLVLPRYGHTDLAYTLFTQTEYPSWGYSVVNGSTSIWERWNSYTVEEGFNDPSMNSFSHYAYGSVAEWMFSQAAGIQSDGPGFRKLLIKPEIGKGMDFLQASYESINGLIATRWEKQQDTLTLQVSVPANTVAKVYLPTVDMTAVRESGEPISKVAGIEVVNSQAATGVIQIGSGNYRFAMPFSD